MTINTLVEGLAINLVSVCLVFHRTSYPPSPLSLSLSLTSQSLTSGNGFYLSEAKESISPSRKLVVRDKQKGVLLQ